MKSHGADPEKSGVSQAYLAGVTCQYVPALGQHERDKEENEEVQCMFCTRNDREEYQ
jgi:hypothetical protein